MKRILYSVSVVLLSMTFMACPYKSDVPIDDKPKESINSNLLGTYEKKSSSSYTFEIEKESEKEYKFIRTSTSKDSKSKPSEYFGYTSNIGGKTFLQMYKKSKYSSPSYYLYRMSVNKSNSILTLDPITEHIKEKFESSEELRNFINTHKNLSFFYGKTEKYYRSE